MYFNQSGNLPDHYIKGFLFNWFYTFTHKPAHFTNNFSHCVVCLAAYFCPWTNSPVFYLLLRPVSGPCLVTLQRINDLFKELFASTTQRLLPYHFDQDYFVAILLHSTLRYIYLIDNTNIHTAQPNNRYPQLSIFNIFLFIIYQPLVNQQFMPTYAANIFLPYPKLFKNYLLVGTSTTLLPYCPRSRK